MANELKFLFALIHTMLNQGDFLASFYFTVFGL